MFTVLDIETSGLKPDLGDFATGIGLLDPCGMRIHTSPARLFRANYSEAERQALRAFAPYAPEKDEILITYNGIAFDAPFLKSRFGQNLPNTALRLPEKHIDLFLFAKEMNNGIPIAKDVAASKFANLYVPRNSNGAYLSAVYSQHIVTDEDHMQMQMHLAQDLYVTWQLFNKWKTFPRFREHCVKNFGIELDAVEVV